MQPVKPKWACAAAVLLLFAAGVLVWHLNRGTHEPRYQGRSVSSWFRQYYRLSIFDEDSTPEGELRLDQAAKALDALGTNSLPYLLSVCFSTRQDTRLQTNLNALVAKLPKAFRGPPFVPAWWARVIGEQRVIALKLTPGELLPSITNYLAGPNLSQRLTALCLLLDMDEVGGIMPPFGTEPAQDLDVVRARGLESAAPWLARSLPGTNSTEQLLALEVITRFGPSLRATLADLVWLQAKSFQAESSAPAAPSSRSVLWRCTQALGAMGTNAAPALPLLKEQLGQLVRRAGRAPARLAGSHRLFLAEAVCRIDAREWPTTLAVLEEFRKGQRPDDAGQFAKSLSRIGPNAKPGIPILLDLLHHHGLGESDFSSIAGVLREFGVDKQGLAKTAIPILLDRLARKGLWDSELAQLRKFRVGKRALHRALLQALQVQDPAYRILAARALLHDDPGNAAAIDALIEIISSGGHEDIYHAIPMFGHAGPAAKAAIPVLRQLRNGQEKGAIADLFRTMADAALARIEGPPAPP